MSPLKICRSTQKEAGSSRGEVKLRGCTSGWKSTKELISQTCKVLKSTPIRNFAIEDEQDKSSHLLKGVERYLHRTGQNIGKHRVVVSKLAYQ